MSDGRVARTGSGSLYDATPTDGGSGDSGLFSSLLKAISRHVLSNECWTTSSVSAEHIYNVLVVQRFFYSRLIYVNRVH